MATKANLVSARRSRRVLALVTLAGSLLIFTGCAEPAWRSQLYPENWSPGYADAEGRFLHDFSYAGYHRGERDIPHVAGPVIDVTQPPYLADRTGKTDATLALQAALDAAGQKGGGVVYLPAGTYRIKPSTGATAALSIRYDRVILRGAGTDRTFLFNDEIRMRNRRVIEIKHRRSADWYGEGEATVGSPLAEDVLRPTVRIPVVEVGKFAPGDLVVLRHDLTQRFIDELEMTGKWRPAVSPNRTMIFCRRIVSVDPAGPTVELDVPIRYPLRRADHARINRIAGAMITEVGLEDFSLGMRQHPVDGLGMLDFDRPGTAAYDTHLCSAIVYDYAENCWARRVNSYRPPGNRDNVHILSNGVVLERSRCVTVEACDWRFPQYRGEGGNGYLIVLHSQESLIHTCRAEGGRHNYDFATMASSGNVILDSTGKNGMLASDFHSYLSVANLIDNMTCDGDWLEAKFRPFAEPMHGVSTTQSVFWNTLGLRYGRREILVDSHQFGNGYVIGTRGPAHAVDSTDYVEGMGKGDTLQPRSLYLDQQRRRIGR